MHGGFAPPALLGEREPQVVVGLGVAGLDPQGLLVVPDRLVAGLARAGQLLRVAGPLPKHAGLISEQQGPIVTDDSVDGGRVSRAEAAVFVPQHARALRV